MNMKFIRLSKNRGSTLLELLVAMTVFSVIMTLAVAAFLNIVRTKSYTSIMKNTQYKVRLSTEIVNRLSREASRVYASRDVSGGNYLELYYENEETLDFTALRFEITENQELMLYECRLALSLDSCPDDDWINPVTIIGDEYIVDSSKSYFVIRGGIDSVLEFGLKVATKDSENYSQYYSDEVIVKTSSVLEGLK